MESVNISEKFWDQIEGYIWKCFATQQNRHELALG